MLGQSAQMKARLEPCLKSAVVLDPSATGGLSSILTIPLLQHKISSVVIGLTHERGSFHCPRVKSGNGTGALPLATDISLKGAGALQATAS